MRQHGELRLSWVCYGLLFCIIGCVKDSPTDSEGGNNPSNYNSQLDDFEDNDRFNQNGGYWFSYDDSELWGTSTVNPKNFSPTGSCGNQSAYCGRISGNVTTAYEKGYIGLGTHLSESFSRADISGYKHIGFWAKGDGKNYRFKLKSEATSDPDDFGFTFVSSVSWTYYQISFSELAQEGWGNKADINSALKSAPSLNWQTVGQPHSAISLYVDDIGFLK